MVRKPRPSRAASPFMSEDSADVDTVKSARSPWVRPATTTPASPPYCSTFFVWNVVFDGVDDCHLVMHSCNFRRALTMINRDLFYTHIEELMFF